MSSTIKASAGLEFQINNETALSIDANQNVSVNSLNIAGQAVSGYAGFKNRIINGDMKIDQRNAGAAQILTNGAPVYTVDRWIAACYGGNGIGQQISDDAGGNRYRITGGSEITVAAFYQRIESKNSYDLAGSTATLSVDLANSLLTTVTWAAYYANSTDTWSSATQIATGTFTVNSTVTNYSAQISIPSAATTGLQIEFVIGAQTSGTFTVGSVQLEKGDTATSFDYRPYGTELNLCQRYYWQQIQASLQFPTIATGTVMTSTTFRMNIQYRQTMRTAPSITISSSGTVDVSVGATASAINVITAAYSTPESSLTDCSLTVASTVGQAGVALLAQPNSFIRFSAEL